MPPTPRTVEIETADQSWIRIVVACLGALLAVGVPLALVCFKMKWSVLGRTRFKTVSAGRRPPTEIELSQIQQSAETGSEKNTHPFLPPGGGEGGNGRSSRGRDAGVPVEQKRFWQFDIWEKVLAELKYCDPVPEISEAQLEILDGKNGLNKFR